LPDVKVSPTTIVMALGGALILGIFGWMTFGPAPAPPPPPKLSQEARAYLSSLKLSNVHMQAAENYVNARLVEILGEIGNNGPKTIKLAEVTCVFRDYAGQEIARERALVVGGRPGPLPPGQTRSFRLPFDTIPQTWNQAMPTLVIAQIQFE
jgi:hypothetical protein